MGDSYILGLGVALIYLQGVVHDLIGIRKLPCLVTSSALESWKQISADATNDRRWSTVRDVQKAALRSEQKKYGISFPSYQILNQNLIVS